MAHERTDGDNVTQIDDFIDMLRNVVDCVDEVEDVDGLPGIPRLDQSQAAIAKMRNLMASYAARHAGDGAAGGPARPSSGPSQVSIGPGPYAPMLVKASDGSVLYNPATTFGTEGDAIADALDEARRRHLLVNEDVANHWVRDGRHFVDFGSHEVYACIASVGGAS